MEVSDGCRILIALLAACVLTVLVGAMGVFLLLEQRRQRERRHQLQTQGKIASCLDELSRRCDLMEARYTLLEEELKRRKALPNRRLLRRDEADEVLQPSRR